MRAYCYNSPLIHHRDPIGDTSDPEIMRDNYSSDTVKISKKIDRLIYFLRVKPIGRLIENYN